MKKIKIPIVIEKIVKEIKKINGKAILVGGSVRDFLLGLPLKDYDIEVYNLKNLAELKNILRKFGIVNEAGKSFGVLKFKTDDLEADFSFPRKEKKILKGHKGFEVKPQSDLAYYQAALRRDFTINSMGVNLDTGEFLDPFSGKKDLKKKVLRHVSLAFEEDPLRALRAVQFAGRFNLTIADETIELIKKLDLTELPAERVFEEFKKLLLKSKRSSAGFIYLPKLRIIKYFPELEKMVGLPQDPLWHKEGDVWMHTLLVLDEMAKLKTGDEGKDLVFMLAALCHDLGKATTTEFSKGHWRSHNHQEEGVEPTRHFLQRITRDKALIKEVVALVQYHLQPTLLYKDNLKNKVSDTAIRKLSTKVVIKDLLKIAKADHFGSQIPKTKKEPFLAGEWFLKRAQTLQVKTTKPKSFLTGKDLLKLGFLPGPQMGKILKQVYEMQLEGKIKSRQKALFWVTKRNRLPA